MRTSNALVSALVGLLLIPSALAATPFADVPEGSEASEAVVNLAERGIIGGFPDGTFRPALSLTRAELLKIALRAAGTSIPQTTTSSFRDVPATHTLLKEIEAARAAGITSGYEDGTFRPDRPTSRGEAVKIICGTLKLIQTAPVMTPALTDVSASSGLAPAIYSARTLGIITPFKDGTFQPDGQLSRANAAVLLWNALLVKEGKPLPTVSGTAAATAPVVSPLEVKLAELINASRAEQHLSPLVLDPVLSQIARTHSQDLLAAYKNFDKDAWTKSHDGTVGPWLTHDSSDGTSFEKRLQQALTLASISSAGATENVGWATYNARSPEDAVRVIHEAMMAETPPEDGHRRNILGQSVNVTHVGVGIIVGENPKELYVTTDFVLRK